MTKRFSVPLLAAIALVISSFTAAAQPTSMQRDTLDARIYFRQGESALEPGFRNNGAVLAAFCRDVNAILADSSLTVHAVTVETGASPEGGVEYNERLAMERARSIRRYLVDNLPLSASQIKAWSTGIDWEGLTRIVRMTGNPWKDEILDVIARSGVRLGFDARADEKCKADLMAIDQGRAWTWMNDEVFPELRHGAGTLRCIIISRSETERVRDTIVIIHDYENNDHITVSDLDSMRRAATDEAVRRVYSDRETKAKGNRDDSLWDVPVAAVRTNLLLPLLNVGAELPLGNRWSIAADVYYPWIWRNWMNRAAVPQKECVEGLAFSAEGRVWLGSLHDSENGSPKWRLSGHSVGVALMGGYGDFCHDYTGWQGEALAAAVSYMYSLPLGRRAKMHLEFEVAGGWAWAWWRGYQVHEPGGALVGNYDDGTYGGPLPLRAAVSLVIPFYSDAKR